MAKENLACELAVIGGGPAGLAAAIETAKAGARVSLFDENEKPGGQLFKQIHKFFGSKEHQAGIRGHDIGYRLLDECQKVGVDTRLNTVVWGIEDNKIGITDGRTSKLVDAQRIIVATGASENPLSVPGWTLPGVMGAGAAQTMMNVHRVLPGTKVLMVGSGNVGLIVSYQLLLAGAEVLAVVEALPKIGGYVVHAAKLRRAGVPILTSTSILEARGKEAVKEATICSLDEKLCPLEGCERILKVDLICLAVGLSPLAELCWMAGCKFKYLSELGGFVPIHDENMRTTLSYLYLAGDVAGVEEASSAMEEGKLAGVSVAEELGYLKKDTVEEEKYRIRKRLSSLRLGPFGDMRTKAKLELMRAKG